MILVLMTMNTIWKTTIPGVVEIQLTMKSQKVQKLAFTNVIQHVVDLCEFCSESTMVEYIASQEWAKLHHITTIPLVKVNVFQIETSSLYIPVFCLVIQA
jgi:hypothetical protein